MPAAFASRQVVGRTIKYIEITPADYRLLKDDVEDAPIIANMFQARITTARSRSL